MTETIVFNWGMVLYPLVALGYFEFLRRLDRHWSRKRPLTVEENLASYARYHGISEYDVFHRASAAWCVSRLQVDADFKTYLKTLVLPHYVRDFIRKAMAAASTE